MKTRRWIHTCAATAALAAALWLALPAHAASISATATAASTQPGTVPVGQDLQNGDFLIHANNQASLPHVTGDGVDEATTWAFDFTSHPQYAAFMAGGGLVDAWLTLTLNTAFFVNGVAPITDIVFPSDGVNSVFPGWTIAPFINGVFGTYSSGSITANLVDDVGMSTADLFNWLSSNNGLFPMLYADDAIVTSASLTLVSSAVPEPHTVALVLAGLLAIGGGRAGRRIRLR